MQKYHGIRHHNQKGRSILELIAIIAVFGVIAIGIYTLASRVLSDRSDAAVTAEVAHIADGAKSLLRWYGKVDVGNSGSNTDDFAQKTNAINEYMVCQGYFKNDNGIAKNCNNITGTNSQIRGVLSNNSPVYIELGRTNMAGTTCTTTKNCHRTVSVNVEQLNKSECIALATADWGKDLLCINSACLFKVSSGKYERSQEEFPFSVGTASKNNSLCSDAAAVDGEYTLNFLFF